MSQPLANQHDAFFKKVMSEPLLAGTFLREHLPPDLVELLILESPELLPGSFVDEALAQHHSDLLFRVPLKSGDQVLSIWRGSTMARSRRICAYGLICRR